MNKVIEKILPKLIEEPVFKGFKIRKSDECLIRKTSEGFEKIEFDDHFQTIDLKNNEFALQIRPHFERRFNVLSKWFEKYSFKDIKTQRNLGQIFDGLGDDEFLFYNSGENFDKSYNKLRDAVICKAEEFFNMYSTMEKMYSNEILPLLNGEKQFRNNGSDWMFHYLKLIWIVDRKNYYNLKDMLLKHIEFLMFGRTFKEPAASRYYDKLNEIFAALEQD